MITIQELFDLTNRTAIITGGGGFLGQVFAEALLEAGAYVVLFDKDEQSLESACGALARFKDRLGTKALDMTVKDEVDYAVGEVFKTTTSVDILVHSAAFAMKELSQGGNKFFAAVEDYDVQLWEQAIKGNLTSAFLICKAIGSLMKKTGGGTIINIASDVGVISPDHRIYQPDPSSGYQGTEFNTPMSYSASKSAIISMTRYLATYWATDGIRVNCIAPAGVFRGQEEDFVKQLSHRIPMARMAQPSELKGPIVFLASDASSFVTGECIMVDGGRTAW